MQGRLGKKKKSRREVYLLGRTAIGRKSITARPGRPLQVEENPKPVLGEDVAVENVREQSRLTPRTTSATPLSDKARRVKRPEYVRLPSDQSFAADALGPPTGSSSSSHYTHTVTHLEKAVEVLVVDDNALTRTLMMRMLTRMGCNVSTAENGEVALDMILSDPAPSADTPDEAADEGGEEGEGEGSRFGIIFLDNQMPVMSGLNMVTKLREMGRRDFVMGITGNALLDNQQEYLEAGLDHLLIKPALARSLLEMLALFEERSKKK